MSHLVTATLGRGVSIRKETHPVQREKIIASGFSGMIAGEMKTFFFTETGSDQVDLIISGVKTFDLDNPIDKHNWISLKAYLHFNPDEASTIEMYDPQYETEKANERSLLCFKVETFIRDNEADKVLLTQLYRRLKGLASGVADKIIFKELIELSKTNPELFMNNGEMIVAKEEWELYALIDSAIEKNVVFVDPEGRVRKDRNTIYAQDIVSAVFQLKTDSEFRVYLQRGIEGKRPEKNQDPKIEDSDFVNLLSTVAVSSGKKEVLLSSADVSIKDESEADIARNIQKMLDAGILIKTGEKINTRYTIESIGQSFPKKALLKFFEDNNSQYVLLKKQASVQ